MNLTAAISIGNEKSGSDPGTLTCFARKSGVQVLLSAHHVIFDGDGKPPLKVGTPDSGSCRSCCVKHTIADATTAGIIGNVPVDAETYVDCAIAHLRPGFTGINVVQGLSGKDRNGKPIGNLLKGTRGAVENERVTVATFKKLIPGKIAAVNVDVKVTFGSSQKRQLLIEVDAGFEEDIVTGSSDSGAAVINQHNEIVGLMWGRGSTSAEGDIGTVSNTIIATPIHAVITQLGITIPPQEATDSSTAETLHEVPPSFDTPVISDPDLLRYRELVLQSERGTFLHDAGFRHGPEVVRLVHHCRPVTVTWHRSQGPAWAVHFINSTQDPNYRVPVEVNGITQTMLLSRMAGILAKHGSEALRQDIENHGSMVFALSGVASVSDALTRLDINIGRV